VHTHCPRAPNGSFRALSSSYRMSQSGR
jgi:hypothetical protein